MDTGRPYLVETPSGRTITVFVYHGELSRGVAFNGLLNSGRMFADNYPGRVPERSGTHLVNLATDGESYGHHHRNGDMALASCLDFLDQEEKVEVINYATFLEKYPALRRMPASVRTPAGAVYTASNAGEVIAAVRTRSTCRLPPEMAQTAA